MSASSICQEASRPSHLQFLLPSDTVNTKRVKAFYYGGSTLYLGGTTFLYQSWYKEYEKEKFHFFNDGGEWFQMDKVGHIYSTYQQMNYIHSMAKWTGISDNQALNTALISSLLFQTTIEVMDGFSSKWGFSVPDIAANIGGSGLFYFQQKYWNKQVFTLKFSSSYISYSDLPILSEDGTATSTMRNRAEDLFGSSLPEWILKDYNAQKYWLSIDLNHYLSDDTRWPDWINMAIGYSAENMLGGYENRWMEEQKYFSISDLNYQRYQQFYIGLDLDVTGFKSDHPIIKTLQDIFSAIKIPAPAIEINTKGEVIFHLLR